MIPKAYIDEWRAAAPWSQDSWVEQDLVMSRALVEIFRVPEIAERLAFRGGTALYKLHLLPAARYSEDIDLVQTQPEPIGKTLDLVREVLDPWLGKPNRKLKEGRVNLVYRFGSEDSPPVRMRLKLEINTREQFSELGLVGHPLQVESQWFAGEAEVTTFDLNELLGTKLRALYQRKKGRDLFDLWLALDRGLVDVDSVIGCFSRYLSEGGHSVSRAQFEENLKQKEDDAEFRGDIEPLLRPDLGWDFDEGLRVVETELVARLPGAPWRGTNE